MRPPPPALAALSACAVSLATLLAPPLPAQAPPGAEPPRDVSLLDAVPAPSSPAGARWAQARAALAQDAAAAVPHLLAALELHPDSPPLLADLVQALAADADAQALWLERLCRAQADAQGRVRFDAACKKQLQGLDVAAAGKLAVLRAQAAAELVRAAERLPAGAKGLGNGLHARWLCELALQVMADAPALLRQHGEALARALDRHAPAFELLLPAVRRVLLRGEAGAAAGPAAGPTTGPTPGLGDEALPPRELALRAARIVLGLQRQIGFGKDLQGPAPPELGDLPALAAACLQRFDQEVVQPAHVYTVDELRQFDAAARAAFTAAHRSWAAPGIAESPGRRYRIETTCGFETLLGAAEQVELHHARLARHCGSDPFAERQGVVRIVPEAAELETEGAPFWWAGGFQGGDRTVIRFAWNNLPSMGRLLTHELTHRFDGVLHAFLPAWYGEGHACWTAAHYARMADLDCLDGWLDVGTCAHVLYLGYGGLERLQQLLAGTLDDYRDNYPAGYALYAYLRGHPPGGTPTFAAALAKYEKGGRAGRKDPVDWFTATFCDGKDGRPATLAAFASGFERFLRDCADSLDERRRGPSNAWVARHGQRPDGDHGPVVGDEPTWSWARARAEPCFGQGHAGELGRLLAAAGEVEAAAAALCWSLQCEGWQPRTALPLPALLLQASRKEAAFAGHSLLRRRLPQRCGEAPGAPPPLPRTAAYAAALEAAAAAQNAAQHQVAGAALAAEAARLRLRLGAPAAPPPGVPPTPLPRPLCGFGLAEDGLTGYEDRRVPHLWYPTPEGDLHVGREQPRDATGTVDRQAHRRDAFVRTVEYQPPGEYAIAMRVHFTTAFAEGAIVLGHWRRDRDLRLGFTAGDRDYAIGREQVDTGFRKLHLHLGALWERDGRLPLADGNTIDFAPPKSWFDLRLLVRGPALVVEVDGERRLAYTTPDGAPIEGAVGFAMAQGAIRVQQPTVQRLDLLRPGGELAAAGGVGLDLAGPAAGPVEELLRRPVRGLPPTPGGALVLWLPPEADAELALADLRRTLPVLAKMLQDQLAFPQPWLLALPKSMPAPLRERVQALLREFRGDALPVCEHALAAPLTGYPWVLFVDGAGVLRAAAQVGDAQLYTQVQQWAQWFRAQ